MQALALFADLTVPADQPLAGVLWQAAIGIVGTVLTALMAVTGRAVAQASHATKFQALVNQLWVLVQAVVAHAEADLRPQLAKAMEDGTLSPEEGAQLKAQVLDMLRATAGEQLGALVKSFGLPEGAVNTLLSGLVERAVALLKEAPAPTLAAPPLATLTPAPVAQVAP